MHTAIIDLIERCPRLRQLDHCDFHEKRKATKLIKIHRKKGADDELERVWYEVQRPPPWYVFRARNDIYNLILRHPLAIVLAITLLRVAFMVLEARF